MNLSIKRNETGIALNLTGKLGDELLRQIPELLAQHDTTTTWDVDLSEVTGIDARGTVALLQLAGNVESTGGTLRISDASEAARNSLDLYRYEDLLHQPAPPQPPPVGFFEYVGEAWYSATTALVGLMVLAYDVAYWCFVAPFVGKGFKGGALVKEISRHGTHAIPILSLVSFLFGLILSINGAYLLSYWGQNELIADMIGVGFTRELGPALVGIMLAARSGAAMSAEIGTMEVREEIDAMWTMGMNPAKHLVVPKVAALALVAPVLSLLSDLIGIAGSFVATTLIFGVNANVFLNRLQSAIYLRDVVTGLGKSAVFGILVAFVGCWFGHSVEGHAEDVGDAATRSVVWGIVLVIVADGFFSTLFYIFNT